MKIKLIFTTCLLQHFCYLGRARLSTSVGGGGLYLYCRDPPAGGQGAARDAHAEAVRRG